MEKPVNSSGSDSDEIEAEISRLENPDEMDTDEDLDYAQETVDYTVPGAKEKSGATTSRKLLTNDGVKNFDV